MSDSSTDDVRLCDVMSVKEARELLGLTHYQMRWRTRKGIIERVTLPNGVAAVLRSSVETYAKKHGYEQ